MEFEKFIDRLDPNLSSSSLRELANTILRMADSLDQKWDPSNVKSNYPYFSKAGGIERNALLLSFSATKEAHRAKIREEAIGNEIVGDPAWNILLELFKQFAGGAKVSTKTLQIISGCPETTALRVIDRLEERGLVIRSQSATDKRVTFITLAREGVLKVGAALERLDD